VSTSHTARRTPIKAPARKRPALLFGGAATFAIALVAVFIVFQTMSGGSSKVPSRVATGDGYVLGDANAPVTIVEYADFQCPVCKRAETSVIPQLEKDYIQTGKVKLEFRAFPFIGQESFNAAQAAAAAADQGKFWEYHDALYNAQGPENGGNFTYDKLVAIAKGIPGLDVAKFEQSLSSNAHLAEVQKEADTAAAAGVKSTPTFFVIAKNGDSQKILGLQDYSQFQAAIAAALDKAQVQ